MSERLVKGMMGDNAVLVRVLTGRATELIVPFPKPHLVSRGIGPCPGYERAVEVTPSMVPFLEPRNVGLASVDRDAIDREDARVLRRAERMLWLVRWEYRLPWLAKIWARVRTERQVAEAIRRSRAPLS